MLIPFWYRPHHQISNWKIFSFLYKLYRLKWKTTEKMTTSSERAFFINFLSDDSVYIFWVSFSKWNLIKKESEDFFEERTYPSSEIFFLPGKKDFFKKEKLLICHLKKFFLSKKNFCNWGHDDMITKPFSNSCKVSTVDTF